MALGTEARPLAGSQHCWVPGRRGPPLWPLLMRPPALAARQEHSAAGLRPGAYTDAMKLGQDSGPQTKEFSFLSAVLTHQTRSGHHVLGENHRWETNGPTWETEGPRPEAQLNVRPPPNWATRRPENAKYMADTYLRGKKRKKRKGCATGRRGARAYRHREATSRWRRQHGRWGYGLRVRVSAG